MKYFWKKNTTLLLRIKNIMNTLPRGNFFKNSEVWLVSPNLKGGREIFAPLYSAAMRIL